MLGEPRKLFWYSLPVPEWGLASRKLNFHTFPLILCTALLPCHIVYHSNPMSSTFSPFHSAHSWARFLMGGLIAAPAGVCFDVPGWNWGRWMSTCFSLLRSSVLRYMIWTVMSFFEIVLCSYQNISYTFFELVLMFYFTFSSHTCHRGRGWKVILTWLTPSFSICSQVTGSGRSFSKLSSRPTSFEAYFLHTISVSIMWTTVSLWNSLICILGF